MIVLVAAIKNKRANLEYCQEPGFQLYMYKVQDYQEPQ